MRTIKAGNPNWRTLLRGTCRTCGHELECARYEATYLEDRVGERNACHAVKCPTCDRWIYVKGAE